MSYTNGLDKPSDYFSAKLYTGNESNLNITGLDFAPNLVWIKDRTTDHSNCFYDSVRGVQKRLQSNNNEVEGTDAQGVTAFNSDGFSIGNSSSVNQNNDSFVSWNWKESTVAGFDIIAYQGTGSNLDLSHNLSAIPDWIMIKNRSVDQAWRVYHKSMGFSNRLVLSETGGKSTNALGLDADPTSSVINIGTGTGCTNASGENFICYAFKNVQGFSKFGSYTGNGNADGTFVYTGFKPAWVLIKPSSTTGSWYLFDSTRNSFNVTNSRLKVDGNEAESSNIDTLDIISNGFKLRDTNAAWNGSGTTYIYMCFSENPFTTSTGVPATAR